MSSMNSEQTEKQRKRANIRLAVILGLVAIGFFILGLNLSVPSG